jgi:hypothetical protein
MQYDPRNWETPSEMEGTGVTDASRLSIQSSNGISTPQTKKLGKD